MSGPRVAIVGGGYSGTALAIALARRGASPILIERGPRPGRGAAYGTSRPEHLLNVRANGMSAFADAPADFADWFARQGGSPIQFAPRRLYGAYIVDRLAAAMASGVSIVPGTAADIDGGDVLLADGRRIEADAAVLALGNFAPALPAVLAPLAGGDRLAAEPWTAEFAQGLTEDDAVLLVGTGLTAVDAAVTLEAIGYRGRILALSRRGLRPRSHAEIPVAAAGLTAIAHRRLLPLMRFVRAEAKRIGWRAAVDQLRPLTIGLWQGASDAERRRFLRHLRPWWDVHRHRIAPQIARRLDMMEQEGRLAFAAGRIVSAAPDGAGAHIRWRPRGSDTTEALQVRRVVNCTGPEADIARAGDPLLDRLQAAGTIRPDALRLAIDVDDEARVIGADGALSDQLYAIGPMSRGHFWEIVAVPDIRLQVAALADRLTRRS